MANGHKQLSWSEDHPLFFWLGIWWIIGVQAGRRLATYPNPEDGQCGTDGETLH
jgi:hypothetical protein